METNQQNTEPIACETTNLIDSVIPSDNLTPINTNNPTVQNLQVENNSPLFDTCKKCLQKIPQNAQICHCCGSYQSGLWLRHIKPYENLAAILISGIIAAAAIIFSSKYSSEQIQLAKQETTKAKDASILAFKASNSAVLASNLAKNAQENAELSLLNAQHTLGKVNIIKDNIDKQRVFNLNLMNINDNYAFLFFLDNNNNYIPIENYFNPINDGYSVYGWSNTFYQSYYNNVNKNRNEKFQFYADLMEYTFISWYSNYFRFWYVTNRKNGIMSGSASGLYYPGENISGHNLINNYFNNNDIFGMSDEYKKTINWTVPPKVSIECKRSFNRDTVKGIYQKSFFKDDITFKHELFQVHITIVMTLPNEVDAIRIDALNIRNKPIIPHMKLQYCEISYSAYLNKDFVFNEENSRYYHWIKDFNEGIKKSFDWHTLKN